MNFFHVTIEGEGGKKMEKRRDAMSRSSLPHEIIVDILSRLPVKSLLRFRCVCKPWCTLVTDPNFIKMHLKRSTENNDLSLVLREYCSLYSIEYDASCDDAVAVEMDYPFKSPYYRAEILGSSNGLLCIIPGDDLDEVICLWNPSTKEYKKLPFTSIEFSGYRGSSDIRYGFGYDPILEDYKVVRLVYYFDDDVNGGYDSEVMVYTLGTNSWKRIQDIPYYICYEGKPGILVNGALHWIAIRIPESQNSKLIVSFDIGNEEYREVPQPDYLDHKFDIDVGVLGGCLYILRNFYKSHVEVWVMKDYCVRDSWTKLFTISQPTVIRSFEYLKPLLFSKNGEILLEKDKKNLVLYDPKCERARNLKIRGIQDWLNAETYLGSLVSLKSGKFVGRRNRRQKK